MEKEKVINRLEHFGYKCEDSDSNALDFTIVKTENHIFNMTNCKEIPEELLEMAIDMACAEFLKMKKAFGQLGNMDIEQFAKSISMGDVSISISDDMSPDKKFDTIIEYMLTGNEDDIIRHRRMVW